jgi:hypothetical protein
MQILISSDGQNNSGDAEWLAGGPGLNADGAPLCFIFRPEATDPLGTNVFRTWQETIDASNAAPAVPKEICFDSSQATTAGTYPNMTVPTGTYDFTEITGLRSSYQGNNATQVDPIPLLSLSLSGENRIRQIVEFEENVVFTPPPFVSFTDTPTIYIKNLDLQVDPGSTEPLITVDNSLVLILENSQLTFSGKSPTAPVIRVADGAYLKIVLRDSSLTSSAVGVGDDSFLELRASGQTQLLPDAIFSETGTEWGLFNVQAGDAVMTSLQVDEDLLSAGSSGFSSDADVFSRGRRRGVERSLLHRTQLRSSSGFSASLVVLQAAMLTFTANPSDGETIVIEDGDGAGTETYTFKTVPAASTDILIGPNPNQTAINAGGTITSASSLWGAAAVGNSRIYGDSGSVGVVIRRLSQDKPHYADRLHGTMSAKVFRWNNANNYTDGVTNTLPATDPGTGTRDFGYGAVLLDGGFGGGDAKGMAFQSALDGKVYFSGQFPATVGKPSPGQWNAVVGPSDEEVILSSGGGTPSVVTIGDSVPSLNGLRVITVSVTGGTDQEIQPPLFQDVFPGARYTIRRVDTDETSTLRLAPNGGIGIEGVVTPNAIVIPPGGQITIERQQGAAEWLSQSLLYSGDATNTTFVTERSAVQKTLTLAPGATGTTVLDSLTKAVVIDATGAGPYDIDLMPIAHWPPGVPFFVARTDAAADVLTLSTLDGSLIDGAASATIGGGAAEAVTLINNQVNWFIVGRTP